MPRTLTTYQMSSAQDIFAAIPPRVQDSGTEEKPKVFRKRDVVRDFLAFLSRERVRYCVLGDIPDSYPKKITSDIDVAFDFESEKEVRFVINLFCQQDSQTSLISILRHEHTAFFYVLAFKDKSGGFSFLQIDACIDYYRDGRLLIEKDDLILNRRKRRGKGGLEFFVPAPASEFKYYLIKKIEKKSLSKGAGEHLSDCWREDMNGCMSVLNEYFSGEDSVCISHAAELGNWDAISDRIADYRTAFQRKMRPTIPDRISESRRIIRRLISPPGFWVAIFGPDGIGKSTLIEQLIQHYQPAFWGVAYKHFRPRMDSNIHGDGAPVTNPHAERPRSGLASVAKIAYYFFDYWLGYLTNVRLLLSKGKFVIFDRYADDIKVDPIRYRYSGPRWLVDLMCKGIPRPDLVIVLDAPASLIQSRKSEVNSSETERQLKEYEKISKSYESWVLMDASGTPEEVFNSVQHVLTQAMARRYISS